MACDDEGHVDAQGVRVRTASAVVRAHKCADHGHEHGRLDSDEPRERLIDGQEALVHVASEVGHLVPNSPHVRGQLAPNGSDVRSRGHLATNRGEIRAHLAHVLAQGRRFVAEVGDVASQPGDARARRAGLFFQFADPFVKARHATALRRRDLPSARFYIVASSN